MATGQMSEVIAIKEGGDLDLNCPIRSAQSEDMIISWTCDNEPANIRSSRIHVTESGKLRIRSAKVGDSCNYRCEAADGYGTLSSIIKVIIVEKKMIYQLSKLNQSSVTAEGRPLQRDLVEKSAIKSETINDEGSSMKGSIAKLDEQTQQPSTPDLDILIEPAEIHVNKNRTFSLECRVKYLAHQRPPQIIWLKQFIGRKPNSPNEAHEQNLVIIDDVYYHSLNWPRSITYSQNSACANSALFIRQSSFVHSGRYICFAGYPPYTLLSRVNLSSNTAGNPKVDSRPLKYKMAKAMVTVDDPDGEANHKLALEWTGEEDGQDGDLGNLSRNMLSSFFSTNNWLKNISFVVLLGCCFIYAVKFVYIRYRVYIKKRVINQDGLCSTVQVTTSANQSETAESSLPLAIKQVQLQLFDSTSGGKEKSNSTRSNQSECLHQASIIESQLLNTSFKRTAVDDHLYSEIGERDKPNLDACGHYKVPNKIDHKDT